MPTINELKEQVTTPTPLFLFECLLRDGSTERWCTHEVEYAGEIYRARLLRQDGLEFRASIEDGLDAASKLAVTLANADSRYSQVERQTGFKGSKLTVRFVFYDLAGGTAESEARVIFQGVANSAELVTEGAFRLTFTNRFSLQRIALPEVRIQRRCPWLFPVTAEQRAEAQTGGEKGPYSALYRCGYSAGLPGGEGALDGGQPFTGCDYTRASCEERGMFDLGRFGGVEFVPAQVLVRGHGEPATQLSALTENRARYNDVVPLVYGTAWYEPPVVFARNDGNLTHFEVLLGLGEIDSIVKVIVNDVEIPEAREGADMTGTGWYRLVTAGARSGVQNPDFQDSMGNLLGDPYGSMAVAGVAVPNRVSNGQTLPRVKVLLRGLKLEQFDAEGASLGTSFSGNPAWVLLDVLRRSGWLVSEVDVGSFAAAAAYCGEQILTTDLYGNEISTQRYQSNLVVRSRRSAAEVVRGIRAGSSLLLGYGSDGLLRLGVENTLALQQGSKPPGSNSVNELAGGWPAYEFSDGSEAFSGILRRPDGEPALRLYSRGAGDTPNRLTVEFQDEYNEYQQDSLSLVDVDDVLLTGREVTAASPSLGLPSYDQATRVLELQLAKAIRGNIYVELETSVKGVSLTPGDLITVTYGKEGLSRQLFRVVRIAPGTNFESVLVTGQWHEDAWYPPGGASAAGGRGRDGVASGVARPLVGVQLDEFGNAQFGVTESLEPLNNSEVAVKIRAAFQTPRKPASSRARVPLAALTPMVETSGGSLAGGQTLYYALAGKDAVGAESGLSFTIRARIPSGSNTNLVTITGLSFSPETVTFDVYRGPSPAQLLRIAADQAPAESFTDNGMAPALEGPPDPAYDHANFYWRREVIPETNAQTFSANTIGAAARAMGVDDFQGAVVRITRGRGTPQERQVASNTETSLTVTPPWTVLPDATSYFTVAEGTWKFGGVVQSSPAEFPVAVLPGETVQISGRAANALNREGAYELNPVTRWQVGVGGGLDTGAPPEPVFGVNAVGNGMLEIAEIGFTTLDNTRGISAGVWDVFWWNELESPSLVSLEAGVEAADTVLALNVPGGAEPSELLQIGAEILEVLSASGTTYTVVRGALGSSAASHSAGAAVYHLQRTTAVMPFVRGFFGSPASGTFRYSIYLPNVRVGVATLYMLNGFGNGEVGAASFGATVDQGLRTLSGGQISIQVEGYLAIEDAAAPAFVMESSDAVRDIFAIVRQAPLGGDIALTLRQGEQEYCTLTIPAGETISGVVNGFGLPPLASGEKLYLDINAVPGAANTLPGRDLTVTIRL